ncbi:hypothetical protein HS125_17285 [bacterium]|nr:hypothetical protein [bacterium]
MQVRGASVTIEDCTIHNRIEEALRDASSGAASAADVHSFRNLEVRDVGGPAILVANTSRARNVISTCSIRNVTAPAASFCRVGSTGRCPAWR